MLKLFAISQHSYKMVKFRWKLISFAFPILSQANNNKYSDYNKSRFPTWVTASVTEDANCDPKHLSAADKFCMPNKNSWEHQYPIVFSEIEKDNIKNAMKSLYGNPQGRQRVETVLNGQTTLSQDVWDFAQNIFYRDGDLFVVPNAGQYQRLMKFNSDGNAHTEFVQQQQSNEFNDNFQQEQVQTDEHMDYAKDFCHFLTGSESIPGKKDQTVNEHYAKAPSNGLAESVMYTPHSQAEFKMLFENEDYKTFNDQTIPRGNEFQGKSLCELQNPDGSSNSKFWTGLYREGKNFRVRSNANNPLFQINLKTDDPWFSTDFRDPAKNVCSKRVDGDFMYGQMETRKDVNNIAVGCPDGISNDDSNNDDPSREGEKCWQNERHPLKYQNFKNQHIKSLNNLDSGTNTRQRDCIIVQCERNNKEAFFYRDICSQINFVPVCRVPLLSCAKTNTCDKQTYTSLQANPKNQNTFCGRTRIVKETNDFASQTIPSQISRALSRMNANFVFEETTSNVNAVNRYAVPWVFQPKRELLVSNNVITRFTPGTSPFDMFDPDVMTANGLTAGDVREATSQDKECPCECGCIETHPGDFDQGNPITDSDIHFHRLPFVNKVASMWPQSTWTNQNRQDYIRFQYDKDYTSNVNSDWIYGNQIGQENAFKCHANLVSATNQLGNPTDFFQENKFTSGSMEYIRTECKEKIYCSKLSLNDGNACDGNTDFSANNFRITSTHARHFYEKPDTNAVGEVESDSVPVTTGTVRSAILENDSGVFQLQTCPQRHNEMRNLN